MIETLFLVLPLMLSPGPANLVTFALTARFGFAKILPFLLGISLVYIVIAIVLGAITSRLAEQYADVTNYIRVFGSCFIVYLGVKLLRRRNRNTLTKAPSLWNGITLQLLNPKYPPVVLSVFANSQNKNTLITAAILCIIGVTGLVIYASAGMFMRRQVNVEKQLGVLDFVFGLLLCFTGIWLLLS
ncbi:LysE family translocator [Dasania sp. GY-MA-18]|uniref:LysE family translocator n=1 Tax=Dasania phycosphaerae TaxID=2950436 RepID=A0A9J6RQA8_9GAMM|nr:MULTISPECIES: LysE family translocator [Dasania]MCR8923787.1 LysE family translocator [Dasania sp. GY-MA-18]MCZ0866221.1 LysE family translocator [Dasania phycosphaerae]MCZ0869945.1 LysE family translocator [Dasania phycosphaerae]